MKKKFNMGVLAVVIAILLSIFLVNAKKGYHIDEIYTYVLSNRVLLSGEYYSSINKNEILNGDYFMQWITAEGESRFNIRNVVNTMTTDNHPPLYFIVFNAVSSLIPGLFTKWTGATVNLIFFILTCFAIKKLAALLCADKYFSTAVCTIYALSPAVIAQNTFYRMYVTLAFWVVMITYLILYYLNKKWDFKFCTGLCLLSVCGTLTQYYFLIYIFFLILFAGIGKLFEKQLADCLKLAGTMSLAGIVCVTLYPSILQHLFSSSRGKEAFSNLSETSFTERIKAFGTLINNQIYGGLGIAFLLTVLVYAAIVWKSGRRLTSDRNPVIVVLSTLLYMIIISKIAPYITNRYIFPVYPLVILFSVLLLWKTVAFLKTSVSRYLIFVMTFGGFTAGSLYNYK